MALFMISYDLAGKPESHFANLIEALEAAGAARVLRFQWLYRGNESAAWVFFRFVAHVASTDRLLVTELGHDHAEQNPWAHSYGGRSSNTALLRMCALWDSPSRCSNP